MNGEQTWLVAAAGSAIALVLLVACALLWRHGRRLSVRLARLEAQFEARTPTPAAVTDVTSTEQAHVATYLITGIDDEPARTVTAVPSRIDGRLFADIVARESVVKAAGLAHGLRRALSAESRNRMRFEFRREVKRSRKQRRADLKAALRQLQAQEDAA